MSAAILDIQALFAFDLLMTELHVTRAAQTMGVSQSAMSHILARLRAHFKDPLLVRTTRGMEATPRALELVEPIRTALRHLRNVSNNQATFDAKLSTQSFSVRMGDMNEFLLLPDILSELQTTAPKLSITVSHLSPAATLKALDNGEIDFAISARLSHSKSIRSTELLQDKMVCLLRKGHPCAKRPLNLDMFLQLRHINIIQSTADTRFIEGDLLRHRVRRNVVLNIPHWLAAPAIVEKTDLVAVVSERMANRFNDHGQFVVQPLPLARPHFVWRMYWHGRHNTGPAHIWLRESVKRICSSLGQQTTRLARRKPD
jgi:DNA-binding transcriptional LysR family regulator